MIGAALGAIGVLGWIVDAPYLYTFLPRQAPMMPNAGLALIALGIAGSLCHERRMRPVVRWLTRGLGGFAFIIGTATFAQYLLGVDLGIDQRFIPSQVGPYPGRPSPLTAWALILLASGMLTLDTRPTSQFRPSELLITFGFISGFTAALGLLFGTGEIYTFVPNSVISVAVPSMLSVLLLSTGLLLMRPEAGILHIARSPGPGGMLVRRLGVSTLLVSIVLGLLVTQALTRLGIRDFPLVMAILAAAMTLVGLLVLAITAAALERSHAALVASEARVREFVERASDGIFVADRDGRYMEVNEAGCRMLGRTRDEIVGKPITELIHPQDLERFAAHRDEVLKGRSGVSEWQIRKKDGSYTWIEVSERLHDDGRWQGFARDISARKVAEQAARRAIQARDDTLGVVAHDLRNPLGIILAQAELLLLRAGADAEAQRCPAMIKRAARRMDRLIQDLLDVRRVEAGQLHLAVGRVSAQGILTDIYETQRPLADAADLRFHLDAAADLPAIRADRDRLLQVFENLIGNAIKFTPAGGSVTVGAIQRHDGVVFCVADTGVGLTDEQIGRLFDPFWQAQRGARRGAGLGLPIAKGIVESHGGRMWVESRPGEGSLFRFTIPRAPEIEAHPTPQAHTPSAPDAHGVHRLH